MVAAASRRRVVVPGPRSHVEKAHEKLRELEEWLFSEPVLRKTLDDVEREQERRGREIQRLYLQAHLERRGTGDVGRAIEVMTKTDTGDEIRQRLGEHRHHERTIHSVFGEIEAQRTGYFTAGAESIHPLDKAAAFPKRTFSYELQRRTVVGSVQGPFDEAVERVAESTGVVISKRSAEQIVLDAAEDFDAFYTERKLPSPTKTGPILVASIDGKGVPMVKPETALRVVRRGSGKKANKKRMATVAAVFTQQPRVRTPMEVVESLFREGPRLVPDEGSAPRWPGPERKRIWASLAKTKDEVIAEVARELNARDPDGEKRCAVVIDGEQALQRRAAKAIPNGVEILDLLHVVEKVWTCAYCFHPEGSDEAKEWAYERILRILHGNISQVVKGIRSSATKRELPSEKLAVVTKITGYFYRNRRRMAYDEYLREGLPIASGSVEGACKNLVKDRMERSGMRWTVATAEAMLRLRAIYLSGDFDDYWQFHMMRDQARLHPARSWRVVEK
jgi:hypothetical protein